MTTVIGVCAGIGSPGVGQRLYPHRQKAEPR
jgi:hypothetical protein